MDLTKRAFVPLVVRASSMATGPAADAKSSPPRASRIAYRLALLVVAAMIATPSAGWAADKRKLAVTITLRSVGGVSIKAERDTDTGPCRGTSFRNAGTEDLVLGAPVVAKNAAGKIVASTQLPSGVVENLVRRGDVVDSDCVFRFSLKVPDSKFWSLKIGAHPETVVSLKDAKRNRWKVDLTY